MEETIVLYSTAEHLNTLSCLATLIAKHHPCISIVVLSTAAPPPAPAAAPSISYRRLPTPSLPPNTTFSYVELFFEIPRFNNPNLQRALEEISQKSKIRAIVLDFFCNYAVEVATTLSIPAYFCHTTSACGLCALLYWPTVAEKAAGGKLDDVIDTPGCPLVPSPDLPQMMRFPHSLGYKHFYDTAINMQKSAGIIANTFHALEPRAFEALKNDLCTPNARTPPVYALGPLVDVANANDAVSAHECLKWLDLQPSKSVIFLCFGRRGAFSAAQLREMAVGLENSGYRFLWAVRSPPGNAAEEPDLEALLPEGFLERSRERALVVKSWAPQTEVLSHDAVGGFVTHCGQSSMLEALSFGVPMIGWPLYAEQKMNGVFMAEEMRVALPVEAAEDGFVTAAQLENKVWELMDSKRGKEIKRRVEELKFAAAAAARKGGSSVVALENFVKTVTRV